jgi:hypothetical protein
VTRKIRSVPSGFMILHEYEYQSLMKQDPLKHTSVAFVSGVAGASLIHRGIAVAKDTTRLRTVNTWIDLNKCISSCSLRGRGFEEDPSYLTKIRLGCIRVGR